MLQKKAASLLLIQAQYIKVVINLSPKKRFLLRLDQEVYNAVEKWANDDFRSANAQIELIIKTALKNAGRLNKGKTRDK